MTLDMGYQKMKKKPSSGIDFLQKIKITRQKITYINCQKSVLKTIGFNELKNYLKKKYNLEIASQKSIQTTKNYAKRQYTWFKHQFLANIVFKTEYKKNKRKKFLKEITDKLLTI